MNAAELVIRPTHGCRRPRKRATNRSAPSSSPGIAVRRTASLRSPMPGDLDWHGTAVPR